MSETTNPLVKLSRIKSREALRGADRNAFFMAQMCESDALDAQKYANGFAMVVMGFTAMRSALYPEPKPRAVKKGQAE